MSSRSYKRIPSREGKILRHMRQEAGLSLRQAASRIGISNSMISHIEIGRENVPKARLLTMVEAYGNTMTKFREYMDGKIIPVNLRDECIDLLKLVDESQLSPVHVLIQSLLHQGGHR